MKCPHLRYKINRELPKDYKACVGVNEDSMQRVSYVDTYVCVDCGEEIKKKNVYGIRDAILRSYS